VQQATLEKQEQLGTLAKQEQLGTLELRERQVTQVELDPLGTPVRRVKLEHKAPLEFKERMVLLVG
jgi:hypothetical protein